ncbi:MAG: PrsW family glutamic-type intramembrane protease [Deltaproteobacteria bacterium]
MFEILAASAIVPSLLLIWYFRSRDVNPEPGRVVWATFFLGVLTVVPVLLVDYPITLALGHPANPFVSGVSEAFLVAAIPEEFFKFLVITLYAARHKEFDEPMDGIVYGAVASLGFATLENILYVSSGGIGVAIMRAITAVPGHAFMGAIAGYYVGQAKFNPARRGALLIKGYVFAVILHGLYDTGLLSARAVTAAVSTSDTDNAVAVGLVALTVAVFAFEWVWAVRLVRRLRAEQLQLAAAQHSTVAQHVAYAPQYPYPQQQHPVSPMHGAGYGAYVPPPGYGPPAVHAPPVHAARAGLGTWIMLILGGMLATAGGLITLAVAVGLSTGTTRPDSVVPTLIGTAVIGIAPLVVGLFVFARGVKGLSQAPTRAVPYVAPAQYPGQYIPR